MLEGVAGRLDLCIAYEQPLTVALSDCPEGETRCEEKLTYSQVIGFDLTAETVSAARGAASRQSRAVGRVLMALHLDRSDERSAERWLDDAVAGVSGHTLGSFEISANTVLMGAYEALALSKIPARVCEIGAGRRECHVVERYEDHLRFLETPEDEHLIDQFEDLLEDRPVKSRLIGLRSIVEQRTELRFRDTSDLARLAAGDPPLVLPATIIDSEGQAVFESTSLDLYDVPMWVAEWTVAATRVEHGARPRDLVLGERQLIEALVPFRSLDRADQAGSSAAALRDDPITLSVDAEEIVARAVEEFDARGGIDLDWIVQRPADSRFLRIACRADRSAVYRIGTMTRQGVVANPEQVCRTLRDALD